VSSSEFPGTENDANAALAEFVARKIKPSELICLSTFQNKV
jgi:hypothetical protein